MFDKELIKPDHKVIVSSINIYDTRRGQLTISSEKEPCNQCSAYNEICKSQGCIELACHFQDKRIEQLEQQLKYAKEQRDEYGSLNTLNWNKGLVIQDKLEEQLKECREALSPFALFACEPLDSCNGSECNNCRAKRILEVKK